MKPFNNSTFLSLILAGILPVISSCTKKAQTTALPVEVIRMNTDGQGEEITLEFTRGKAHNHPLMAVWLEDSQGKYIQTLFVAESIGKGVFDYGTTRAGKWAPGEIRRPAALPYWGHQRNIQAEDGLYIPTPENPVPDAYTGATPQADFILMTKADRPLPEKFRILLEINQTWDWNEYWTNNKYPDNTEYKTSSQPALVYAAEVELGKVPAEGLALKPIGHSHYAGENGDLYTDLSTLTTALDIALDIRVKVRID